MEQNYTSLRYVRFYCVLEDEEETFPKTFLFLGATTPNGP